MRLRYTPEGLAELDAVSTSIERDSVQGAGNVMRKIRGMIDLVSRHPGVGQPTRNPHLRRFVASPYPYVIFYQATADEIGIHGVRHGAQIRCRDKNDRMRAEVRIGVALSGAVLRFRMVS